MHKTTKLFIALILAVTHLAVAEPGDLDVPGAQAKYDAAKAVADRARTRMEEREREFRRAEGEYLTAVSREQSAQSALKSAESKLDSLDDEIDSLERRLTQFTQELNDLERRLDSEEDELRDLEQKRQKVGRLIEDVRHDIHHVDQELSVEKAKPTPDPAVIQKLEAEHASLAHRLGDLERDADRLDRQIRDQREEVRRTENEIRETRLEQQTTQTRLNQANRERQDQVLTVQSCRDDLRRAQDDVRWAQSRMESARAEYNFAKADYQKEAAIAQQKFDYLQQVIANYNRERDRVVNLATNAGRSHGGREADERAVLPGQTDGKLHAAKVGNDVGTEEGQRRDFARGQRDGRENGAQLSPSDFSAGREAGRQIANEKALKEEYPKGYNDSLKALLSAPPASEAIVDMSEETPGGDGGSGAELSPSPISAGVLPAPDYAILQDPPYILPVAGSVSPAVPARDNRYFAPPCHGMALPEFGTLCQRVYDDTYGSGYAAQYRAVYGQAFGATFTANIQAAYDSALSATHPASREAGLKQGARESGTLKGFVEALPGAKEFQYTAGQKALRDKLATGYLPIVRAVEIAEENRDGLFTPGEKAKLRIVIDNYGAQPSPARRYRVRVTGKKGLEGAVVETRELPALAASTRTILEGVVSATIASQAAKQKLALEGVLEGGSLAYGFATDKEVHFPLELESITLSKKAKIDEKVAAVFRYRNLTRDSIPETSVALSTSPQIVAVEPASVAIPQTMGGETVEVTAQVKPGMWVGENTYVPFFSTIDKAVQPFPQYLSLDRSGVILLFDEAGRPVPNSTLVVRAGGRAVIQAQFKFLRPQFMPGPFVLKAENKSQASISHSSGSTVSVNYGSARPGTQFGSTRFSYDIPAALKGKTEWVMIVLRENNRVLHAMQVYLDIR